MSNNHRKNYQPAPREFIIRQTGGRVSHIIDAEVDLNLQLGVFVRERGKNRTRWFPISNILEVDMPGVLRIAQGKIIKPGV